MKTCRRRGHLGRIGLLVWVALATPWTSGCDHPTAQRRLQRRDATVKTLTRQVEQSEAKRPAKIDRTLDRIAARHDRDAATTATVGDRMAEAIDEDLQRWQDRQPRYREAFDKARRGDPDTATESMMHLLF